MLYKIGVDLYIQSIKLSAYGVDLETEYPSLDVAYEIKILSSSKFRRYYIRKVEGYNNKKAYELLTGKAYRYRFYSLILLVKKLFKGTYKIISFPFSKKFHGHWMIRPIIIAGVIGLFTDAIYFLSKGQSVVVEHLLKLVQSSWAWITT